MSRERTGNVTMVGLRSDTNLFLEKRLMWKRRYGGSGWRRRYRLRVLRCSCDLSPSYLERMEVRGIYHCELSGIQRRIEWRGRKTCGMMFLSSSS